MEGPVPDAEAVQGRRRRRRGLPDLGPAADTQGGGGTVSGYRYGLYHDGPDPLEPPLRRARRRGRARRVGARWLGSGQRAARPAAPGHVGGTGAWTTCSAGSATGERELRSMGRLDGILEQARALPRHRDRAGAGRVVPRPARRGPAARGRARQRCPPTPRRPSGGWPTTSGSPRPPGKTFEQLKDLLRPGGARQPVPRHEADPCSSPTPAAMQRVKDMIGRASHEMLDADAQGTHTSRTSTTSWRSTGTCSPTRPAISTNWSTRWSAGCPRPSGCSARSPTPSATRLAGLMSQTLEDAGWPRRWPGWPARCGPAGPTWISMAGPASR